MKACERGTFFQSKMYERDNFSLKKKWSIKEQGGVNSPYKKPCREPSRRTKITANTSFSDISHFQL